MIMPQKSKPKDVLVEVVDIAKNAGNQIMTVYRRNDTSFSTKSDSTPLTEADIASNRIIEKRLSQISTYPIISEEGVHDSLDAKTYWVVDPLDGTKEFIKRNGEFTVNIALIKEQKPILGVVYAPAIDVLYAADYNGAFKITDVGKEKIEAKYNGEIPTVAVSRSHLNDLTKDYLKSIGRHTAISMGSSLKLCLVAEGKASHYPRFGPTYTWDTAAADAVVRIAGGKVTDLEGNNLLYPPRAQKNPFFIARSR
jgi:3'(2'), 5'-bisphosphate nucleotidase